MIISIRVWSFAVLLLCGEIRFCKAQTSDGGTLDVITLDDLSETSDGEDRLIVVDPNGGGDVQTINAAIEMVPDQNHQRVKIRVLPGIYEEKVLFPASKPYISLIGDPNNPDQIVITGHAKASDPNWEGIGIGTVNSSNVVVESDYFCASGITFENTGLGAQAVAIRVLGDKAFFNKVRFIGSQDTLMADKGSHYFHRCFIQGSIDFICGNGRSLFKECLISVASPGGAVAAQKRDTPEDNTGFSFVDCTITGVDGTTSYLGRAWGVYSRVIFSRCKIDIDVVPGGWHNWGDEARQNTVVLAEYNNTGKGATSDRVPWSIFLSENDAEPFLDSTFIDGQQWLRV